jgi:hypothetical protein
MAAGHACCAVIGAMRFLVNATRYIASLEVLQYCRQACSRV